jgi:hypothetical protein
MMFNFFSKFLIKRTYIFFTFSIFLSYIMKLINSQNDPNILKNCKNPHFLNLNQKNSIIVDYENLNLVEKKSQITLIKYENPYLYSDSDNISLKTELDLPGFKVLAKKQIQDKFYYLFYKQKTETKADFIFISYKIDLSNTFKLTEDRVISNKIIFLNANFQFDFKMEKIIFVYKVRNKDNEFEIWSNFIIFKNQEPTEFSDFKKIKNNYNIQKSGPFKVDLRAYENYFILMYDLKISKDSYNFIMRRFENDPNDKFKDVILLENFIIEQNSFLSFRGFLTLVNYLLIVATKTELKAFVFNLEKEIINKTKNLTNNPLTINQDIDDKNTYYNPISAIKKLPNKGNIPGYISCFRRMQNDDLNKLIINCLIGDNTEESDYIELYFDYSKYLKENEFQNFQVEIENEKNNLNFLFQFYNKNTKLNQCNFEIFYLRNFLKNINYQNNLKDLKTFYAIEIFNYKKLFCFIRDFQLIIEIYDEWGNLQKMEFIKSENFQFDVNGKIFFLKKSQGTNSSKEEFLIQHQDSKNPIEIFLYDLSIELTSNIYKINLVVSNIEFTNDYKKSDYFIKDYYYNLNQETLSIKEKTSSKKEEYIDLKFEYYRNIFSILKTKTYDKKGKNPKACYFKNGFIVIFEKLTTSDKIEDIDDRRNKRLLQQNFLANLKGSGKGSRFPHSSGSGKGSGFPHSSGSGKGSGFPHAIVKDESTESDEYSYDETEGDKLNLKDDISSENKTLKALFISNVKENDKKEVDLILNFDNLQEYSCSGDDVDKENILVYIKNNKIYLKFFSSTKSCPGEYILVEEKNFTYSNIILKQLKNHLLFSYIKKDANNKNINIEYFILDYKELNYNSICKNSGELKKSQKIHKLFNLDITGSDIEFKIPNSVIGSSATIFYSIYYKDINYLYVHQKFITICKSNQFLDQKNDECINCPENCNSCSDLENCKTCKDNKFFAQIKLTDNKNKNLCENEGKKKEYYFDNIKNFYLECDDSCDGCYYKAECKNCKKDYFKIENSLDNKCIEKGSQPQNYYLEEPYFKICPDKCSGCLSDTKCKACNREKSYFKKKDDETICHKKDEKIDYYYFNQTNLYFDNCKRGCKTCSNSSNCSECDKNNDFYPKSTDKNTCLNNQDNGYVFDNEKKQFDPCDKSCATCKISKENCFTCNENYFKIKDDNHKCEYGDNKLNGYFLNKNTHDIKLSIFDKCDISCKTCEEKADNCLECNDKEYFYPKEIPSNSTLKYKICLNKNIDNNFLVDYFFDEKSKIYKKCI